MHKKFNAILNFQVNSFLSRASPTKQKFPELRYTVFANCYKRD